MVVDTINNSGRYISLHPLLQRAFDYLQHTDLHSLALGKYEIEGEQLFAIVQEYDTLDAATEQMEAHRRYIDVQYIIAGEELVGHSFLADQNLSKEYSDADDYLLVPDKPAFFTKLSQGMFMLFFPTDLHMPCIKNGEPVKVKKVVVKVKV